MRRRRLGLAGVPARIQKSRSRVIIVVRIERSKRGGTICLSDNEKGFLHLFSIVPELGLLFAALYIPYLLLRWVFGLATILYERIAY